MHHDAIESKQIRLATLLSEQRASMKPSSRTSLTSPRGGSLQLGALLKDR